MKNLIEKLYEKASIRKLWWLIRHSAGMLGLKIDESAKVIFKFYYTLSYILAWTNSPEAKKMDIDP